MKIHKCDLCEKEETDNNPLGYAELRLLADEHYFDICKSCLNYLLHIRKQKLWRDR